MMRRSFVPLAPAKPTACRKRRMSRRLLRTTLTSPLCVPAQGGHDTELEQQRLHLAGQLRASGRVRHLSRASRETRCRAITREQPLQERTLDRRPSHARRTRGRACPQLRRPWSSAKGERSRARRSWTSSSYSVDPEAMVRLCNVPPTADEAVVDRQNLSEPGRVDVVEAGPVGTHPTLTDESTEQASQVEVVLVGRRTRTRQRGTSRRTRRARSRPAASTAGSARRRCGSGSRPGD